MCIKKYTNLIGHCFTLFRKHFFDALIYSKQKQDLCQSKGNYEPTPMIVCANKCDSSVNQKVSSIKGQKVNVKIISFNDVDQHFPLVLCRSLKAPHALPRFSAVASGK